MNPNICNNCGGDYEYRNGRWICRSCGSYKPEEISNEEVTLLYMAYQKLRLADFYEAEPEFDDIIQKYPQNPNAYWGRLMAKYGIKYERDYDGKMIPTCYAASIQSVMEDADYQKALKYADAESKVYYRTQAEYIERVRREWIEKASKEKPYDVFICYKDSDLANGIARTKDSIAAQDIYTYLTDLGYHVFYSHVSLQNKVGEKYEPYIFNALSTAKVMLVYGSSPEYITSTWLKNEWTRYEKRIQAGEKKPNSLLVACEGFSPGELPHTLSSRQCFDATDKRFYKNLEETIKNIIRPEEEKETAVPVLQAQKKKKGFLPFVIIVALLAMGGIGYLIWNSLTACNHVAMVDAAVEPTCSEEGLTEGAHCYLCNEILIEQTPVPMLEHTPGAAATCTSAQKCTVCQTTLVAALGHKPGAAATCLNTQTCTVCNKTLAQKTDHTPGTEATCTTAQTCTVCNKELHAALGHTPGPNGNCSTPSTCTVCGTFVETPDVHVPGTEATCTAPQYCSLCNKELVTAKGHTPGEWEIQTPASKAESGLEVKKCIVCGDIAMEQTIPPTGSVGLSYEASGAVCIITGLGDCTDADVIIPTVIDGHRVTTIGDSAFLGSTGLTSIVIPDSVTAIGTKAFLGCTNLTNVTIGSGVTSIGESAFSYSGLTSAVIPDNVTNMDIKVFAGCKNLSSVTLSAALTSISGKMFEDCTALTNITLPHGITHIYERALANCSGLTEITIPNSVTYLAWESLAGCTGLTEITVPDSVTVVADGTFAGCTGLIKITLPKTTENFGNTMFHLCENLTEITLPSNITDIGDNMFDGCRSLTSIIIPDTVTLIGESAFRGCSLLTSITIPDGVTIINNEAFSGCQKLASINIPNGVTKIGNQAFQECYALTSIEIPDSVTSIGNNAFMNCVKLTSVIIPDSVADMGDTAFNGCTNLKSITIGKNVKMISDELFYGCSLLTTIRFSGTTAQWNAIYKYPNWNLNVPAAKVICSDGEVSLK